MSDYSLELAQAVEWVMREMLRHDERCEHAVGDLCRCIWRYREAALAAALRLAAAEGAMLAVASSGTERECAAELAAARAACVAL